MKGVERLFKIGDTVLYGATGVCKIDSVVKKTVMDEEKGYYLLKPHAQDKCTVFVPVDNAALLAKMRKILSKQEIDEILCTIGEKEDIWEENEVARREKFQEIIHSGDRMQVMLLIRSLYNYQQARLSEGKRLHISDERYFAEAERLLYDEFSAVLGISHDEVLPYIISRVNKN